MKDRVAAAPVLGKTLKFDFGEEQMVIDGTGETNELRKEDSEADCTVKVSLENFKSLIAGDLNPMGAVMSGKIKIKGDMGVAMKLQTLF